MNHSPFFALACALSFAACSPAAPKPISDRPISTSSPSASAPTSATGARATGDRTLRFSVLMMDHVAGATVVTIHGDGRSRDATFEFNDRGRGPNEDTHYEVAKDGVLERVDVSGVDYYKQPVEEHLRLENERFAWNNGAEKGDAPASERALYSPREGAPELFAMIARALLDSPSKQRALLPAGRARIERASETTVHEGDRAMHVTRYAIEGFDFEPAMLWLDDDRELFAFASPWQSVVREGWERTIPELVKIQRESDTARLGAIAKRIARTPPAAGLAIVHARLFDAETKKTIPDATIVIKGDRVVAAGASNAIAIAKDVETIDAKGKTAIPGLWDMHAHVQPLDGLLNVANGVTGARDLGNDLDDTLRTKRAWESGTEIGPHLVMAGFIDGRGPFQAPIKVFADTEDEGIADIDRYAAAGCEQIKLYSSLKIDLVAPLAKHAHAKGLRVSGHVPNGMDAEDAVNSGYDELQHANFLLLKFLADKTKDDTRTPLRFTRIAEKAASLDLASPEVKRFIAFLAKKNIVVDPTLATFENIIVARRGAVAPGYAAVAERMPVQVRRRFLGGGLPVPEGMDATYRASFDKMVALVKALFDAGVRIVAGTDDLAGFTLHRELELYARAGIPARDVLALATIGSARVMKHDKEWGSIAPGKIADVVLVDGRPDEKIEDVRKPVTVVSRGRVISVAELDAAVGVKPF